MIKYSIAAARLTEEAGKTSCLANLPITYSDKNTPMKSVSCPLQALSFEKTTLDVKKAIRGDMNAPQAQTYTEDEKNACALKVMTLPKKGL